MAAGSDQKLQQGRFGLDIRKKYSERVAEHWIGLAKGTVEISFLCNSRRHLSPLTHEKLGSYPLSFCF